MTLRQTTDEDFLEALRTGKHRHWEKSAFRDELCRPQRIDALRPLVQAGDLPLLLRLVRSEDPLEVLMAHVIGRKLMRDMPEQVAPAFALAYERWIAGGDLFLTVSLFHDLAEQTSFLTEQREGYASLVQSNPEEVKRVLQSFVGDEAGLLRVFSHRLADVFSDDPKTLNDPGKAFMYVLYLGLVDEPSLRSQAAAAIERYAGRGDSFFQGIALTTLKHLASGDLPQG